MLLSCRYFSLYCFIDAGSFLIRNDNQDKKCGLYVFTIIYRKNRTETRYMSLKKTHSCPIQVDLLAMTPHAEIVIEEAGRTCYLSFDHINATSASDFIRRLIALGHDSPLEHAYATFRIKNGSRAMTHQLVRHRLMAVSQQSQRYVNEDQFEYVVPVTIPEDHLDDYHADMAAIQQMYNKWRQRGLKREDARYVLPNACTSEIVVSANFREWRHILKTRLSKKAQWEIRTICEQIRQMLVQHAENCFHDIEPATV
jgi:thymidylate synthase (FAD)